jgi:hypothetical protein
VTNLLPLCLLLHVYSYIGFRIFLAIYKRVLGVQNYMERPFYKKKIAMFDNCFYPCSYSVL